MDIFSAIYDSPIGKLSLIFDDCGRVYMLHFGAEFSELPKSLGGKNIILQHSELSANLKSALDKYFNGQENSFENLELVFEGTQFQKAAWRELQKIPYGKTISYQEQCTRIGSPKALRAIGQANNKNPIAIIIPCHRVIGKDGNMTGFGGGIDTKIKLLELEKRSNVQSRPNRALHFQAEPRSPNHPK